VLTFTVLLSRFLKGRFMATPFFGKRDATLPASSNQLRQTPLGGHQAAATSSSSNPSGSSLTGNRSSEDSTSAPLVTSAPSAEGGGSKLTVGPNIKLKGVEITDCDTLVVEGLVEATMDSRVIQISEQGAFKGSAEIDVAEIRGQFNGNLTARQKLVIYSTGKVTGTVRYGKLVIEEGGQLAGEVQMGGSAKQAGLMQVAPQVKAA
jgi:cytoskeletal protein CcmA (bactofilin family)